MKLLCKIKIRVEDSERFFRCSQPLCYVWLVLVVRTGAEGRFLSCRKARIGHLTYFSWRPSYWAQQKGWRGWGRTLCDPLAPKAPAGSGSLDFGGSLGSGGTRQFRPRWVSYVLHQCCSRHSTPGVYWYPDLKRGWVQGGIQNFGRYHAHFGSRTQANSRRQKNIGSSVLAEIQVYFTDTA
jgi:hypothetical protein